MKTTTSLIEQAKTVMKLNDMGGYNVPTLGLYPFQWNWDAAITALGWMKIDESRAWLEIEMLLKGQWENGMVPHVIFHQEVDTYFPGPDVWGSKRPLETTSISQPPVLATIVKLMFEQAKDKTLALQKVNEMLPKVIAYHTWWYNERDPENTGLVVSYHPWESGMDNCPSWDKSLAAVPPVTWEYQRKDLDHVDAEERPHSSQYDRYLYLVDFFKNNNFDSAEIYKNVPYKVNDMGIIGILHKATKDLIDLSESLNANSSDIEQLKNEVILTETSISNLWSEKHSSFLNKDVITGEFSEELTIGTLMALYAELATPEQAKKTQILLKGWLKASPYGVASTHPSSEAFEPKRYWRGPVWLHMNWLLAIGTDAYGFTEESKQLKDSAVQLIDESGFYEYFNCNTGEGCGGGDFSWTAAIALHWFL
jgi:neutral trehalase